MRVHIIGLDRGHGGTDPGAQGLLSEVEVNTSVTTWAYHFLSEDPNYEPVLLCPLSIKEGRSLYQRTQAAAEKLVEVVISNHANAGGGQGFECYAKAPKEAFHDESLRLAQLLVKEMQDIQTMRGKNQSGIRYRYYSDGTFAEYDDANSKGQSSYFHMVRVPVCPALLVELCFVDNKKDAKAFGTDQALRRAAVREYHALCAYFGTVPLFDREGERIGATSEMYRIRKSWNDDKSQVGAYISLSLAINLCNQYPGYTVFNEQGKAMYKSEARKETALERLQREGVLDGTYQAKQNVSWGQLAEVLVKLAENGG